MRSPIPDYLDEILERHRPNVSGTRADYIPALAEADPDRLAICMSALDGTDYTSGDSEFEFTIQSMSKPFVYGLVLERYGLESVLTHVGVEPSGEAFNELSLDAESCRPLNPMINAGALTTHSLLGNLGDSVADRVEIVRSGLSAFAGRELGIEQEAAESEWSVSYRNIAIANMLRSYSVFPDDPAEVVRGYVEQCAIAVTVRDLAIMATTLAAGGVNPLTGHRVLSPRTNRQVLGVMLNCGMYDAAGDWMTEVGVPAKSGVSGGIFGVLPGQLGVATFSPRLDTHGTSVRGADLFRTLSEDLGLHIMEAPEPARSVIRRDRRFVDERGRMVRICSLQGVVQWSGAENVLRTIGEPGSTTQVFILDLRRVHALNDVADRILTEALHRLSVEGTEVTIIDPERLLGGHTKRTPNQRTPDFQRLDDLAQLPGLQRV